MASGNNQNSVEPTRRARNIERNDGDGAGVSSPTIQATEAKDVMTSSNLPIESHSIEIGGRGGLDPVRYGDWEKNGRCIDF